MCQHRKWHLHHRDHLFYPRGRDVKINVVYTIRVLKCSYELNIVIVLIFRIVLVTIVAVRKVAIGNGDRKQWPANETLPEGRSI